MKIGTRSLLFGVHCWIVHPWFVAIAWWKLYGFPFDPRLWIAFVVHDWGYWGKPNMDGPEGEMHIEAGARIMGRVFGGEWADFCRYHSRFIAKRDGKPFSRLCVADKLAVAITPWWLYIPMAMLSHELSEYMEGKAARTPAGSRSAYQWYRDVQQYLRAWAGEHKQGNRDTWTGTKRDLIQQAESGSDNQ